MDNAIAERFLVIRGKAKQGDFAKALGINPNTLRNYENGRVSPNHKILERICVEFSVSPTWLLLGIGPMYSNAGGIEASSAARVACSRCDKLETKLEKVEEQRDGLITDNRQLLRENGELRAQIARLEERLGQTVLLEKRGGAA